MQFFVTKRGRVLMSSLFLMQIIPFGCGRNILNVVTPWLLDDTRNILDTVVRAVAPLVLP